MCDRCKGLRTVGFADATATCDNCGHIEHYNYYHPRDCTDNCPECGAHLVPDHMKVTINFMKDVLEKKIKRDGIRKKEVNEDVGN